MEVNCIFFFILYSDFNSLSINSVTYESNKFSNVTYESNKFSNVTYESNKFSNENMSFEKRKFKLFSFGRTWSSTKLFVLRNDTGTADINMSIKIQSSKLYNNKYMIVSTQITITGIFAFISVLVVNLLSCKILFINRKDNRNF